MPSRDDLPSTLRRSSKEAQDIWLKAHDSAVQTYGEGQRAHRTAYAALKHRFEKVGDHWQEKTVAGPSDPQAAQGTPQSPRVGRRTAGGVDVNAPKRHLYDLAAELGVRGRSRMSKAELAEAIQRANQRRTAQARSR